MVNLQSESICDELYSGLEDFRFHYLPWWSENQSTAMGTFTDCQPASSPYINGDILFSDSYKAQTGIANIGN